MKNSILTLLLIAVIFTGCKKETQTGTPETQMVSGIEQRILNFEQQLQSGQKDGITYAIDSAVWYVEALLNYSFCEAGNLCRNITVDTLETAVNSPGSNGFTLEQLGAVYDQLEEDITLQLPAGNIVFAVDLYTYMAGNHTVFAARTAYATIIQPGYKSIADTSGYWFWGADKGMCGPDSGLYVGVDASDILQNIINAAASDVWTSLENHSAYPSQYPDTNFPFSDQYLDSTRIFQAYGPTNIVLDFCLSPDHIEYYLSGNGIWYIINDLMPINKRFAWCDIWAGAYDSSTALHVGTFTYGVPVR